MKEKIFSMSFFRGWSLTSALISICYPFVYMIQKGSWISLREFIVIIPISFAITFILTFLFSVLMRGDE